MAKVHITRGERLTIYLEDIEITLTSWVHKPNLEVEIISPDGSIHSPSIPVHAGWEDLSFAAEDGLLEHVEHHLVLQVSPKQE